MGDIKTRFSIEGEQQFKTAMSSAAAAIKVLNSEQRLAKAQFQQTGNAEKYAAQQSEILKAKIEQQKTAVKAAEQALKQLADNGVQASSRQFQQWQTKLNNAQTALVNMETELQNLDSSMEQTTSEAGDTSTALESIGKKVSLDAVIGGLDKITDAMKAAAQKAKELAAELIGAMTDAANWADELSTQAVVYGIDAETLQRMRYTAGILDTNVETIIKARQKLINNMVYGNTELQESFDELGVTTRETLTSTFGSFPSDEYRDWADVFWEVGDALVHMNDQEQASAMASKIFGRNWAELLPLFKSDWAEKGYNSAREYYDAVMAGWDVVSQENVDKLGALDDSLTTLENNFTTLKETVLAQLAPAFTVVSASISGLLKQFNDYLASDEGQQKMNDLSDAVTKLFEGLSNVNFGSAIDLASKAITSLTEGLTWISNNWESVQAGLVALGTAFAGLTVADSVLKFVQVLAGIKFLSGGAGGAGAAAGAAGGATAGSLLWGTLGMGAGNLLANISSLGGFPGALADMFLNQTDAGRALRDGGDFFEGLRQDFAGIVENLQNNANTFADNWDPNSENANVIAKAVGNTIDYVKESFIALGDEMKDLWTPGWDKPQDDTDISGAIGNGEELLTLTGKQAEAMQKYWDAFKEYSEGGLSYNDLYEASNELDAAFDGQEDLLDKVYALIDHIKDNNEGEALPEDISEEEYKIEAEPVLPADAQSTLQSFLDGLWLKADVHLIPTTSLYSFSGGSHANGLYSVPWDGYPAILHKGERVLTAREARTYNANSNLYVENMNMNNGMDAEALARAMNAQNQRVRAGFGS